MHLPRLLSFLLLVGSTAVNAAIVTVTASASPVPTSPSYTEDKEFQKEILDTTNAYRKAHNASALTWNATIASFGQDWTKGCKFAHSGGPYGENIAQGYPNVTAAVQAWGDEGKKYDFKKAKFSEDTGHFTQLVWKTTTTVGCGRKNCGKDGSQSWFVVCEYYPRGNVVGAFADNVQATIKGATIQGAIGAGSKTRAVGVTEVLVMLSMIAFAMFLS